MATKRIIQLPTLNQNNQITWGNSSQGGYLRKLPNELPWWDWPNPKNVIQTPQTDANGNITGWWWKKTAMNSPEEPEVWTYRGNNGVVQTINKNTTPTNWWFTQYSSKTDRSAALLNTGKNWTTNWLPQATPAGLPWKWKMRDPKNYVKTDFWKANNQAGIDLVNKQNELDTLSEAEKAQRLAGAYNPTPPPTVATAQNPVIKKTLDKPQEETVTPAAIQWADINTLNSTLDELKYKVNVEWKQLTKEEYMTFESARRQLQEMMKPKEYTWFENVINDTKNLIEKTKKEESASNAEELARYTQSQDKRKESQLAILNEQEMTSKKRLASILWWSGQWQSTDTVEQFKALEDSFTLRKQEKINEMQDRVDLYGATLRKDSKETIQALEKRLADQQMKVVDIDIKNLDMINAYNEKQWLSQLEKIDKLQQMADDIIANNTPLTDQQKADAAMRSNKIIKPDWTFDRELWEILKKQNPMIAAEAVRQSTAIQNERISNELAMKWLDADIKRAQLNKLLNPAKEYDYKQDADWNRIAIDKNNPLNQINITWWTWSDTWQKKLGETPIDTGIKNVYWSNVKLAPTVAGMVTNAMEVLAWQWINLKIADSYRSNEQQAKSYASGKAWVAPPGKSFHELGQAFDLSQKWSDKMNDPKVFEALKQAWLQQLPWEWRHWSYWEMWWWNVQKNQEPKQSDFPQYTSYIENGKLPAWMKDWTSKAESFKQQALDWYIKGKEQEFNWAWLTISNPTAFASAVTDAAKIKEVNKAVLTLPKFKDTMDQLISLEKEYWTENRPTQAKQTMNMLVKDAQLQAKEIYNLWVLNWPDLSLMESIIPNPTSWSALWPQILWWVSYNEMLKSAKDKVLWNAYAQARTIWLSPTWQATWTLSWWRRQG